MAITPVQGKQIATASWARNALTASYLDGYTSPFPFTGSAQITGSLVITGSLNVTDGITGSFSGSGANLNSIPVSAITGNFTQIATGSVTASVTPSQFSVVSGSVTEFIVTGTGVTIGNAITDTHIVTGSLNLTGSIRLTGSLGIRYNTTSQNETRITGPLPRLKLINSGSLGLNGGGSISIQDNNFATKVQGQGVMFIGVSDSTETNKGNITWTKDSNESTNTAFNYNSFNDTAIYISGSGNVGIRTTTPTSASLHVSGNVFASSFTGSLLGTSSFAVSSSRAVTSSFAVSASWAPLNAGGNDTQIQFNSGSRLAGTGSFTFIYQSQSLQQGLAVTASGLYSHAEGDRTTASGPNSHAEGWLTQAIGNYSHAEGANTQAIGNWTHAEGRFTTASGDASHAEGIQTKAIGAYSHAEGDNTQANGPSSHAEGLFTTASGGNSHAEGYNTQAAGAYSHAEGQSTRTLGQSSHAEGLESITGINTAFTIKGNAIVNGAIILTGNQTAYFTPGGYLYVLDSSTDTKTTYLIDTVTFDGIITTIQLVDTSVNINGASFGDVTYLKNNGGFGGTTPIPGDYSHAEGVNTQAIGSYSHTEGRYTNALGNYSHAEGYDTLTLGSYSHAEGSSTQAIGLASHAEGRFTTASADYSHTEGYITKTGTQTAFQSEVSSGLVRIGSIYGDVTAYFTPGNYLYLYDSEFDNNYGYASFLIDTVTWDGERTFIQLVDTSVTTGVAYVGDLTYLKNNGTFGGNKTIPGNYSHAEGFQTQAVGPSTHAEGNSTQAIGDSSHAEGRNTQAIGNYQHVQGQFNIPSTAQSAFIHGNGTDDSNRSNLIYAHDSIVEITGSLDVTGGITGNLSGNATTATSALSATSASYSLSSSFAVSSSRAVTSSFAISASNAINAVTASYLEGYISPFPFTGSAQITGSLGITGSLDLTYSTAAANGISVTGHFPRLVLVNSGLGATSAGGFISVQDNNFATKVQGQGVMALSVVDSSDTIKGAITWTKDSSNSTNTAFNYNSSNNTAIFISGSGNVGIKTTTPTSASLTVNGNVWATSFTGSLFGTSSWAVSASWAPTQTIDTSSFATTGSNTFQGTQTITGSNGRLIYTGTPIGDKTALAEIHTNNNDLWLERFYNDTFSTSSASMAYFGWNDGRFVFHNESTQSIGLQVNGFEAENGLLVYQDKVAFVNNVEVTGSLLVSGSITGSLFGTASWATNAITASYASNGGVTQLLAGANITLAPTNGLGQVTISSTAGGGSSFNTATGSYGSFYDTTTQTNPVGNIPRSMSLDHTDITNGVSISGSTNPFNTYIKTENAGVYNIQFSAQVEKTDSGTDEIVIWLRKNGIDLTDTATTITLVGNSTKAVAAWNWFVTSAANDYYQIIWISADTGMRLLAETISGTHPGIPSVIVTANRVDQFLSNTGSFSGSFTGQFTGSLQGTASFATTASYALNAGGGGTDLGLVQAMTVGLQNIF